MNDPTEAGGWSIYALVDPRDGKTRYVGKSTDPGARLKEHLRDRSETRKARWIRSLLASGLRPTVQILEVGYGDWRAAETRWIAEFRPICDLTNACDGGEGLHNPSPETRAKIAAVQRRIWGDPEQAARRRLLAASPSRREAISRALTGRTKSAEHVAALPQNRSDYPWSDSVREQRRKTLLEKAVPVGRAAARSSDQQEHLRGMQESNRGRPGWARGRVLSDEERRVRSQSQLGRPKSAEHREKIRQAALRRWARSRGEVAS